VIFTQRSADLSDGARIALGFFAQDPKTQRLRRIEQLCSADLADPAVTLQFSAALTVQDVATLN